MHDDREPLIQAFIPDPCASTMRRGWIQNSKKWIIKSVELLSIQSYTVHRDEWRKCGLQVLYWARWKSAKTGVPTP
ncbi:hypothetical protein [Terriglobus aquaticus]|uniref:hypothetical protein n=1 Tax=Terriglobus aquaticus TaxID=940139 RepID=UPI0021E041E9|nr:hypothetical protein [Terriglobus aquaticus]